MAANCRQVVVLGLAEDSAGVAPSELVLRKPFEALTNLFALLFDGLVTLAAAFRVKLDIGLILLASQQIDFWCGSRSLLLRQAKQKFASDASAPIAVEEVKLHQSLALLDLRMENRIFFVRVFLTAFILCLAFAGGCRWLLFEKSRGETSTRGNIFQIQFANYFHVFLIQI